jgi:hypothetical protein
MLASLAFTSSSSARPVIAIETFVIAKPKAEAIPVIAIETFVIAKPTGLKQSIGERHRLGLASMLSQRRLRPTCNAHLMRVTWTREQRSFRLTVIAINCHNENPSLRGAQRRSNLTVLSIEVK